MPFKTPTLTELTARAEGDFESRLPGSGAQLRRSNANVMARVHSGGLHGLYGFHRWLAPQISPVTAEAEMLESHHGTTWGINRKPGGYATGSATFEATQNGVAVPAGTLLSLPDGTEFETTAEAVSAAGAVTVACQALVAGKAANAAEGAPIVMVSPVAGVMTDGAVAAGGLAGGADAESDADLRARILARIRTPPHGGAGFDYVVWAKEVAGVTRAWVFAGELGLGTVTVRFMTDDTTADGIPDGASVAAVQALIDQEDRRPVTADVTVVAPVAKPLDLVISGLTPASAEVQAAVIANLTDLLRREASPGATILLSHIREAISIAAGEHDHVLVSIAGAAPADFETTSSQIATLGDVTFI